MHDEATKRNNGLATNIPNLPLMDSRLAYALVHLDTFSSRNRIQLLSRQFQDFLLPVLACYLCIDDGKGSLRADSLEEIS